ncbi:MAG: phytanoyl-CoA dioxygenase family protein [Alphaproteobacteria bacterium]
MPFDLETFRRQGIVFPAGEIDITGFDAKYEAFQAESRRLRGKETYIKPHLLSPWVDSIARLPEILDPVHQVLGPDVVLWTSDWNVKRAGTGDYVPWHQDSPYWNLSTDEVVTVWLAIGDVTVANGAMEVVLGSHAGGRIGKINADGNIYEAYETGQRKTDDDCMFPFAHLTDEHGRAAVPVELKSGEFSIHDINIVHGGGPNKSDRNRVGLGLRYISADTRYLGRIDSVTAISGNCHRDYFVFEPTPDGEWTEAGLAAFNAAIPYPSGFGETRRKR